MKTTWEKEYTLRAGDFDKYNRIKPSAVLDLFQDAAGQHAEEIDVGFEKMLARSYLWVLIRIRFRIVKAPARYQTVRVKTWPLAPNRLNYRREYRITDADGQDMIVGSSEWVVMHSEKRRLLAVPNLYPFTDEFCKDTIFEGRLSKVQDFEAEGKAHIITAGFSELDVNGHVNNTKYADYVLDAVGPSCEDVPQEIQIDYRKEVREGTRLHVYHCRQAGEILAKGQNDDGETMFACRIELKEK